MKKLVSAIACFAICFSIHAQTQQEGGKVRIVKTGDEAKVAPVEHKVVGKTTTEAPKSHVNCPHATTCPKAQAAASSQGEEKKPCCAKHQANKADADAKTEQKAGCNHQQNADQKAKCNHNSAEKTACPKKQGEKK